MKGMKITELYLQDVIEGESASEEVREGDFAVRIHMGLSGDEDFLQDMIKQIDAGRVTVASLLHHQVGEHAFIDAGLVFSFPRKS